MNRIDMVREVTSWTKKTPTPIIGDVTARDGIQAIPWWHIPTKEQRAQMARQMMQSGIPHIEIGFPVLDWDPETLAVRHVVEETRDLIGGIFTLARLSEKDIAKCIEVLDWAKHGGIHVFIGTSPFHRELLGKDEDQILHDIALCMRQVRDAGLMCQFSAEDATRTEPEFLTRVYQAAENNWAQILNVPDTVWYCDPDSYAETLGIVRDATNTAILSAHCHNDTSCAEASPLIALRRGLVEKVEGTVFGIGERAGNTDLVSFLMTIMSHPEYAKEVKNVMKNPRNLAILIEMVQSATGYTGRPVDAWYGFNAVTSFSGVHQAKVAKMKESYVWIDPERFWLRDRALIDIGPLSGRAGVESLLWSMKIEHKHEDIQQLTTLIRSIFSPDTNISDICRAFPQLSESEVSKLSDKVQTIRQEARVLLPTVGRQKQWRRQTHEIVRKAIGYFYGEK